MDAFRAELGRGERAAADRPDAPPTWSTTAASWRGDGRPARGARSSPSAGLLARDRPARRAHGPALAASPASACWRASCAAAELLAPARRGAPRGPRARAARELIAELQARRVTPARLAAALRSWTPAAQHGERRVHRRLARSTPTTSRELERLAMPDAQLLRVRALAALRLDPSLWGATPVLLYGFDDLNAAPAATRSRRSLERGAPVTVSLSFEAGRTAFAGRAATSRRSRRWPPSTSAWLRAPTTTRRGRAPRSATSSAACSSSTPRGWRRTGACDCSRAPGSAPSWSWWRARSRGCSPTGSLRARSPSPSRGGGVSRELLGEVLARAGVAAAIQRPVPLGDSAIGRALIGLLRCVPRRGEQEPPGTSADLLAWLRAPGLLRVPVLADDLERRLRHQGATAVRGRGRCGSSATGHSGAR